MNFHLYLTAALKSIEVKTWLESDVFDGIPLEICRNEYRPSIQFVTAKLGRLF